MKSIRKKYKSKFPIIIWADILFLSFFIIFFLMGVYTNFKMDFFLAHNLKVNIPEIKSGYTIRSELEYTTLIQIKSENEIYIDSIKTSLLELNSDFKNYIENKNKYKFGYLVCIDKDAPIFLLFNLRKLIKKFSQNNYYNSHTKLVVYRK